MAWVLDLDGVIWLSDRPIPGAAEAVARLRAVGQRVEFVTNNSSSRLGEQEDKLAVMGIDAGGAVVTSAMAAAAMLEPGTSALVCGGPGVVEALTARGVQVADDEDDGAVDAVVVGFNRRFDYDALRRAACGVLGGARLIGTNDDATYPTPSGPIPGGGSILAAVAYAAGVEPEVAGKPFPPMTDLVRTVVGSEDLVVVGDRPSTDGRFARSLGARFALVLSGVTKAEELPVEPEPDVVAVDLAALVDAELSGS